jgi:hypothetical protein
MRLCTPTILGTLTLLWCVGALSAGEGEAAPGPVVVAPMVDAPASLPAAERSYPAAPRMPQSPPPPPPDQIWGNLLANQDAYNQRFGFGVTDDPGLLNQWGLHPFITAGMLLVQPAFKGNPAFIVTQQPHGAPAPIGSQAVEFSYVPVVTPRLIVGFECDSDCGFRTSWWYLDQNAPTMQIFNKGPAAQVTTFTSVPLPGGIPNVTSPSTTGSKLGVFNDVISFDSYLHLDVWDFEVFRDWQWGNWSVRGSGGVRYTYITQNYVVQRGNSGRVNATTVLNADFTDLESGHNFTGVGPTVALDGLRPIGDTGFAIYGVGRSSMLFGGERGHTSRLSRQVQTVTTGGKPTQTTTSAIANFSDQSAICMPVEEFEVGAEYARRIRSHEIFVRSGFVSQSWFDAGSATSNHGYLGFFGLALTGGWMY